MMRQTKLENMMLTKNNSSLAPLILLLGFAVLVTSSNGYAATAKDEYELEERCGKNAREFVKYEYGYIHAEIVGQPSVTFVNHYNKKLNKCFVMTTIARMVYKNNQPEAVASLLYELKEVNEHKSYGSFHYDNAQNKLISCNVVATICYDVLQWQSLVKAYMEE
jgi:hypothetical protein